ncbi:hypothetical protein AM588_10004515 [Phytophthora nicotianae]|uniref:Uncharacterized protein n=1 Tax=Phytophthora nicotianae TaxID=4792 RepID=A0A0W8D4L6_PHYNI|nr:hypothetical protein AM588_10004515 [Phytophthora nicotianae]
MRRRGVGIGAVRKKQEQAKQFSEVGEQLVEANLSHVSSQLELFRTNLQAFAIKYKNNIKKDPDFRRKFQVMCAKIGVDPLASKKGFWSELLDVGDFYYELAVQIIEVCIITRPKNGGLIGMSDLLRLLEKKRGVAMQTVTDDDVKRAVKKLSVLGEGFQLIDMEERTMTPNDALSTIPAMLDEIVILPFCEAGLIERLTELIKGDNLDLVLASLKVLRLTLRQMHSPQTAIAKTAITCIGLSLPNSENLAELLRLGCIDTFLRLMSPTNSNADAVIFALSLIADETDTIFPPALLPELLHVFQVPEREFDQSRHLVLQFLLLLASTGHFIEEMKAAGTRSAVENNPLISPDDKALPVALLGMLGYSADLNEEFAKALEQFDTASSEAVRRERVAYLLRFLERYALTHAPTKEQAIDSFMTYLVADAEKAQTAAMATEHEPEVTKDEQASASKLALTIAGDCLASLVRISGWVRQSEVYLRL